MVMGYNLAAESVALFNKHEIHTHYKIDTKNKQVEELVSQMEDLEVFVSMIAKRTEDSVNFDLQNEEDRKFVDKLREGSELAHIFPHGKYRWQGKEIDNLSRMINQHIEGPLQRKITMLSEEMLLEQNELSRALEIFRSGQKRMGDMIQQILNAMARTR